MIYVENDYQREEKIIKMKSTEVQCVNGGTMTRSLARDVLLEFEYEYTGS